MTTRSSPAEGVTDFEQYRVDLSEPLAPTFFVPDNQLPPPGITVAGEKDEPRRDRVRELKALKRVVACKQQPGVWSRDRGGAI